LETGLYYEFLEVLISVSGSKVMAKKTKFGKKILFPKLGFIFNEILFFCGIMKPTNCLQT